MRYANSSTARNGGRILGVNFMKYVFGLGNPGRKYKDTRHNAGFQVVDVLCARHDIRLKMKSKLDAEVGEGIVGGCRVMLVKPQTYMNVSGYAVSAVLDYYDADPKDIIVVYDDIDLPFGTLRIREKGSAGTHNGMRSVIEYINDTHFVRVRLGIGAPSYALKDYVLGKFENKEAAREMFERAADAVECILEQGVQAAQQEYQEKKD